MHAHIGSTRTTTLGATRSLAHTYVHGCHREHARAGHAGDVHDAVVGERRNDGDDVGHGSGSGEPPRPIVLFGSVARRQARPSSDIDLVLVALWERRPRTVSIWWVRRAVGSYPIVAGMPFRVWAAWAVSRTASPGVGSFSRSTRALLREERSSLASFRKTSLVFVDFQTDLRATQAAGAPQAVWAWMRGSIFGQPMRWAKRRS